MVYSVACMVYFELLSSFLFLKDFVEEHVSVILSVQLHFVYSVTQYFVAFHMSHKRKWTKTKCMSHYLLKGSRIPIFIVFLQVNIYDFFVLQGLKVFASEYQSKCAVVSFCCSFNWKVQCSPSMYSLVLIMAWKVWSFRERQLNTMAIKKIRKCQFLCKKIAVLYLFQKCMH